MIKQVIANEFCLNCQGCCRFNSSSTIWSPRLLHQETEVLLKNNISPSFISQDNLKIRLMPSHKKDAFFCAFFAWEDNKCKIYDFRPFECQLYPFLLNRKDDKAHLAVDLNCPFAKEKLNEPAFKEHMQYLIRLFSRPQWRDTLKNNPQIIQKYERAENLKELRF